MLGPVWDKSNGFGFIYMEYCNIWLTVHPILASLLIPAVSIDLSQQRDNKYLTISTFTFLICWI